MADRSARRAFAGDPVRADFTTSAALFDEPEFPTAHELAKAIARRDISATEVLEAHLRQIERHNPALNAIVTLDEEHARMCAQQADAALARGQVWGPLHGVPITVKDEWETAGLRTTNAEKAWAKYVPERDATVVARLRAAGAVVLGKTNLPEQGADVQTNSHLFGRANNPWDLDRTPGGSTGGGAAAVCAGLSPLEIGGDGGGSIRIPAHFCGLFALKPTEHAVSLAGNMLQRHGSGIRHMATPGLLSRCVQDLQLGFRLIAGPDGRDLQVPRIPLEDPPARPLCELKIAWTDDLGGLPVTAATRAVIERLATRLENLGSQVERGDPPRFDVEQAWQTYGDILGGEAGAALPAPVRYVAGFTGRFLHRNAPMIRAVQRGMAISLPRYMAALARRDAIIACLEAFLATRDAWLCPVACGPAFTHRKPAPYLTSGKPIDVDGRAVSYWSGTLGHTSLFNLTGSPVVVLPLGQSDDGLPIGVQVVGRRWHDMELLAVARQLSLVTGAFARPPGY